MARPKRPVVIADTRMVVPVRVDLTPACIARVLAELRADVAAMKAG
jgi:hypothetical protein